jgi:glycosyltransferase involved in cell wall biosynthesis
MSSDRRERLRVLFSIPNLSGGGAERIATDVAIGLPRDRFDVTLFVHERRGSFVGQVEDQVRVVFGNKTAYSRLHLPGLLVKTTRLAADADVIVGANEGRASFLSLLAAEMRRKPFVAWLHSNWIEFGKLVSWRQHLSLRCYNRANAVVAVSNGVGAAFSTLVKLDPGKLRTIYNAVRGDQIKAMAKEPLSDEHARLFEKKTVVAAGRLAYEKNYELLIRSHALMLNRGLAHELVILGEGPLRQELLTLAKELHVDGSVHLLGFQKNPFAYMARATVFTLTSKFEGFALVLAEALFTGAPVVSVACPFGPPEILGEGRYGVLVPLDDPGKLADALERVLTQTDERDRLVRAALDRSVDFDLPVMVGRWAALLEEVAGHRT